MYILRNFAEVSNTSRTIYGWKYITIGSEYFAMKGSANSPCSRYYTHSDYSKFRHLCQAIISFEMMIVYDIASETFSSNYWANELYVRDVL
jgi:hypothetical protein